MIQESLDGRGLRVVLSTVDEFLQYHLKVEQDLYPFELAGGVVTGLKARLQKILSHIYDSGVVLST